MTTLTSHLQACESLIQEHRQMEQWLDGLGKALSRGELEPVRVALAQIEPEMNTHFACEEQILFPAVSPYHPMVLMEVEHENLLALRAQLKERLKQTEEIGTEILSVIQEIGNRFISDMLDHIGREDAGIFPTCEQALSDDEKASVISGMERLRQAARHTPVSPPGPPVRTFKTLKVDLQSTIQRPVFSERLLDQDGLEIKHLVIGAGQSLPSHWSPQQITLVCLSGEGIFTANQQQIDLQSGVSIVLSPQLLHGIQAQSDCHLLLLFRSS